MNRSASLYLSLLICALTTFVLADIPHASNDHVNHQVPSFETLNGVNIQLNLVPLIDSGFAKLARFNNQ
jgi:hypothetical protein